MMVKVEFSNDDDVNKVKDVFYQVAGTSEIMRGLISQTSTERIGVRQLYAYAQNLNQKNTIIEEKLKFDPELRKILRRMIESASIYHLPEAMAASTNELPDRRGKDCRIRFETSRAEPDQIYVIVEMARDKPSMPKSLVVCDENLNCHHFDLPAIRNKICQLISHKNSDLLHLLSDPKSEVFLR